MTHTSDTPIFNLKAVVQETGLKPDTLRAWERRYGIPEPQRTLSGHRLYTQRDIDTLKWLLARLHEGLNISRAVALWQELKRAHGDPFRAGGAPANAATRPPSANQALASRVDTLSQYQDQWVEACMAFDEQRAEQILSTAFAMFPVETVCTDLLQRGLSNVGDGWYRGRVTVQQEHFASALAMRRMEALLASTPPPSRPERILIGCPPDENHTFAPLMLALMLRRRGWNVIYLGANVPVRSLELTVKTTRPSLVIMTAQQLHTAASLLEVGQVLFAERIPLAFGGMVFTSAPELCELIPGHFLGTHLDGAIAMLEATIGGARPTPARRQIERSAIDAAHHFQERRARIESDVWRDMEHSGMPHRHLAAANLHFGASIAAALGLGNMYLLGPTLDWVEGLLVQHYQMPVHLLDDYLRAYHAAARSHLSEAGTPILDWFSHMLGTTSSSSGIRRTANSRQRAAIST
jgi:MerR family transcriptional regulator, light-induced transcriptional regulator